MQGTYKKNLGKGQSYVKTLELMKTYDKKRLQKAIEESARRGI